MPRDEEFTKRLLSIFKVEAAEHISSIASGLFELEKDIPDEQRKVIIEIIYRSAHSLKGASRSVNMVDMESLCQSMEDLLSLLQRGWVNLSDDIKSLLIDSNDLLTEMSSSDETDVNHEQVNQVRILKDRLEKAAGSAGKSQNSEIKVEKKDLSPSVHKNDSGLNKDTAVNITEKYDTEITLPGIPERRRRAAEQLMSRQAASANETIRVSAVKLESLLMKAEELISVKMAARHYSSEIDEIQMMVVRQSKEWAKIINNFRKNDAGVDEVRYKSNPDSTGNYTADVKSLIGFSETVKNDLENKLYILKKSIGDDSRSAGSLVDDLLIEMKNVLLMPFSYTSEGFPRLVRDISREQNKEIELILEGTDVEIDKRVLQEMKDPFIHLIRNSIDHGIEIPSLRKNNGKSEKGSIKISVSQLDAGRVKITFSDDGSGIDPSEIRSAALKHGILSDAENEKLTDDEAVNLIFESGVSTSPIITTMSGRGLGMAIVKERAERLGGSIYVKSSPGKGVEFHIILPVTIATFRGILIECAGQMFVVPTKNVERMSRVHVSEIITVENRDTITYKERVVSLVRLEEILDLPFAGKNLRDDFVNIMIAPAGGRYLAFSIDGVLNEDEMLLKNMGKQLRRVRNISGATVLASGKVVMILHVADIVKSASVKNISSSDRMISNNLVEGKKKQKKSILVVEDSITARSLYVNILEAVGYNVSSAVDGIDGYTKLINGDFDLVVTDVQMPKMNGFELTAKIRSDTRYADIPVVLVTGLESADDKKMGIDSGANAYIEKSSFDQNNLIEVIERFI